MAEKQKPVETPAPTPTPPVEKRYRVVLGQVGRWPEHSIATEAELRAANAEVERLVRMGLLVEVEA
jgi:hypothetical protein